MLKSKISTIPSERSTTKTTSSGRQSILERLTALRQQSQPEPPQQSPNSPRYIPPPSKTTLIDEPIKGPNFKTTAPSSSSSTSSSINNKDSMPSSPTIGRRRLNSLNSKNIPKPHNSNLTPLTSSTSSPIGTNSPKYFPPPPTQQEHQSVSSLPVRNHTAQNAVSNFAESFEVLRTLFLSGENGNLAQFHLRSVNSAFVALQNDLKSLVSINESLRKDLLVLNEHESVKIIVDDSTKKELEESLRTISDLKESIEHERKNVDFLQNYMEEMVQSKEDEEKGFIEKEKKLLKQISELESEILSNQSQKSLCISEDQGEEVDGLRGDNERLRETIKLLELERNSTKIFCQKAMEVIESSRTSSTTPAQESSLSLELEQVRVELKQKQVEIDKLRGREQHFKESNEIFQQKLVILNEENRKLRGQRPINLL